MKRVAVAFGSNLVRSVACDTLLLRNHRGSMLLISLKPCSDTHRRETGWATSWRRCGRCLMPTLWQARLPGPLPGYHVLPEAPVTAGMLA